MKGWVRTHRSSKSVDFIALNDGSTIKNVQIVVDPGTATISSSASSSSQASLKDLEKTVLDDCNDCLDCAVVDAGGFLFASGSAWTFAYGNVRG